MILDLRTMYIALGVTCFIVAAGYSPSRRDNFGGTVRSNGP